MNALSGNVAQRGNHHALALQPRYAGEGGTFDFDGKVALPGAVIARVAAMAGTVVDHRQPRRFERRAEQLVDFVGDWSCHVFSSRRFFTIWKPVRHDRFHGRFSGSRRGCDRPNCREQGEFRAPGPRAPGFDGPGDYRWFCLDHVREFNSGYDWFDGMTTDEIIAAQHPVYGWDSETRAFRPTAGVDDAPRWADFKDPLDAIHGRARAFRGNQRTDGHPVSPDERRAFEALGLPLDADRKALRGRYSQLVRRYHPDRNGGDRSLEAKLQAVVEAYNLLKSSRIFA